MLRIIFNIRRWYGTRGKRVGFWVWLFVFNCLFLCVSVCVSFSLWLCELCVFLCGLSVALYVCSLGMCLYICHCMDVSCCLFVRMGVGMWVIVCLSRYVWVCVCVCEVVSLWFMIWSRRWAFSIRNIECPSLTTSTHHPPTHTHTHRRTKSYEHKLNPSTWSSLKHDGE